MAGLSAAGRTAQGHASSGALALTRTEAAPEDAPVNLLRSRFFMAALLSLAVIAVPLFLITTNLRIIINSGWLYSYGFEKYERSLYTGIDPEELTKAAEQIKAYFNDASAAPLDVHIKLHGEETALFNEREIVHMKDVKGLVRGLGFWQQVTFWYLAGFAVVIALLWERRTALRRIAKGLLWGSAVTLALLLVTGAAVAIGFDAVFTQFHVISFSNDFWQLDPRHDYLVAIFNEAFFRDAVLIVAGMTAAQAALTAGVCLAYRRRTREERPGQSEA